MEMVKKDYSDEISGWLIVCAILFLVSLLQGVLNWFWLVMEDPISYEFVVWQILVIFFSGWIFLLFFKKQETAPSWMIIFYIVSLLLYIVLYSSDSVLLIAKEFLMAAIWMPYFSLSKKVRNTFVYKKKIKVKNPQQFDKFWKKLAISVILIVLIPAGVSRVLAVKTDETQTQWNNQNIENPEQVGVLYHNSFAEKNN